MPDIGGGLGDLGGAVKDIFGGIGQGDAAGGYSKAAAFAEQNAQIAAESAQIQETMATRQVNKVIGGQQADVAGAGLAESGSALDLLRDSTAQGALTKQLVINQGQIDVNGYKAESASYSAMASAAKAAGTGDFLSGAIDVAAAAFAFFG